MKNGLDKSITGDFSLNNPTRLIDCYNCDAQNWPEDVICWKCGKNSIKDQQLDIAIMESARYLLESEKPNPISEEIRQRKLNMFVVKDHQEKEFQLTGQEIEQANKDMITQHFQISGRMK